MIRYFLISLAARLRGGSLLFALGAAGVALGVASVLSIQIINLNALGAFEGSLRAVGGDVDLTVTGRMPTLPDAAFLDVAATAGVRAAWPLVRLDVALADSHDRFVEVLGVDFFAPVELPWEAPPESPAHALTVPGWCAVSPELAKELGLVEGSRFEVTSGTRRVTLSVGAIVDFRRVSPLAGSRMVVLDIAQAQHLFDFAGRISQIDVRVAEGEEVPIVRQRLERRLGSVAEVATPEQRRQAAAGLLGAFRLNLTALSLISLFVGAFLVYESTQAALVRRRNEFGLLRSLGATRGQLLGIVLAEVALLGLIGTAIGLPLGWAAARWNVEIVSGTLTNLYLLEGIESLRLPVWLVPLAALIGLGGAMAGALGPALDASRRDPRALLAAFTLHDRASARALPLLLAAAAAVSAGCLLYVAFLRDWRPGGFVVGVALLVAVPLAAPWTVQRATAMLGAKRFGVLYGVKALGLRLRTTSVAVAALAVAVSMLIGITLMVGSFRRTVEIWIDSTLIADVYVTTNSWSRARGAATLDPELLAQIEALDGVAAVDRLRQFFVRAYDRRVSIVGVDMNLGVERARFVLLRGDAQEALQRARHDGAVLVSEPLARKVGLDVGDRFELIGAEGPLSFPVAGVTYDYSDESGGVAMDLGTMERAFGAGAINNVAIYLAPGVDTARFIDGMKARFAELPLRIRSDAELRAEVFRIFDQTFAVTRLLQATSLVIAACGVTLTLLVLARAQVAELALYRALGATRGQIFRVFLGKGLGIALFGLVLGALGGVALALVLVFVINRAYFGWTIAMHWPLLPLVAQALTILAAAALASLYPALCASRTPAGELSRENL